MSRPRTRFSPKPNRRRALELLASCRAAHGFTIEQIDLKRAGFASAKNERVVAGGHRIEVTRVRITATGQRALV
jgi:hypothetical protein